jgi:hypothetical protein
MDIQVEHMKHRCYFISVMCGMSLYSWYNYSLFDPINNSFFTPYYQNCLLMLFYLGWDTYQMIKQPILFRTDLMIHHSITSFIFLSCINNNTLQISNVMIMECISLMNYVWRNNPLLLKLYRTLCICFIRIPLIVWYITTYNKNVMHPYWKLTRTYNHYIYLKISGNILYFFILYDMYILWKLYKPIRLKQSKLS